MEPNFVLMKLPGEKALEFIEILPFTPANRNNLIGWIAGRSDEPHYGNGDRLQLSRRPGSSTARCRSRRASIRTRSSPDSCRCGTSRVRTSARGSLIVIPVGRALLYAEPIYLQAERSPMPELRIVVLALQDRLAYGPTFEAAHGRLFGAAPSTLPARRRASGASAAAVGSRPHIRTGRDRRRPRPTNTLIAEARARLSRTISGSPPKESSAKPGRGSKR